MKLKIEIDLDNEAFGDLHELSDMLTELNDELFDHADCTIGDKYTPIEKILRDSNGNTVGKAEIVED